LAALPRLWATRKIGALLNQVRLHGADQETIDQIVRLSIRYGIVTPYTSYLVTEKAPLGVAEQERLANETFGQMLAMPTQAPSGQQAVQSAADAGAMQGAGKAPELVGEASTTVRVLGPRTFVLSEGKWIDTAFDPGTMKTTKIDFLSADYFSLVASHPDLADAFALGEQVIALSNGVAYEVMPSDAPAQPAKNTPTPVNSDPITPTNTPTSTKTPSQTPTQSIPGKPSGICGTALLPLVVLPLLLLVVKKPERRQ
ncbi:MAG TPA: hypothetical protein VF831_02100, partial [Anaerolineales bacterium]